MACVKKGIAFCKLQLVSAATSFKAALSGISFEESLDIQDGENEEEDDDDVEDDVDNGAISDDERVDIDQPTAGEDLEVTGENLPHSNLIEWKFPVEISQSTLDGRNGSYACSVIALIFAHKYTVSALTCNQCLCYLRCGLCLCVLRSELATGFTIVVAIACHSVSRQQRRLLSL